MKRVITNRKWPKSWDKKLLALKKKYKRSDGQHVNWQFPLARGELNFLPIEIRNTPIISTRVSYLEHKDTPEYIAKNRESAKRGNERKRSNGV